MLRRQLDADTLEGAAQIIATAEGSRGSALEYLSNTIGRGTSLARSQATRAPPSSTR